jgi:hypothetical protein
MSEINNKKAKNRLVTTELWREQGTFTEDESGKLL